MRAYRPELEQSTAVGLDAVLDEPERCEIVYGAQQFERRVQLGGLVALALHDEVALPHAMAPVRIQAVSSAKAEIVRQHDIGRYGDVAQRDHRRTRFSRAGDQGDVVCDGAELLDPLRRIAPHSPRAADHLVAVLILLVDEHDRVSGNEITL
ncbi:Uncharacterised protein [Mycobacteroides abscessus]|nr:Uncharacterised protein [Mycobacteroides abscessus]